MCWLEKKFWATRQESGMASQEIWVARQNNLVKFWMTRKEILSN